MIYSKIQQNYVPISVTKTSFDLKDYGLFTRYKIFDKNTLVGQVDLRDTNKGVFV